MPPMKLVLFDIDGTLLRTPFSGNQIMTDVGRRMFGPAFGFDGAEFAGQLDRALFNHAMQRPDAPTLPEGRLDDAFDRFGDAYADALDQTLARIDGPAMALPGGLDLVRRLARQPRVDVGIVTGNLRRAAWLKLHAAGFQKPWFSRAAFGDDHTDRAQLVADALEQHRQATGQPLDPAHVLVVGDTPRDVHSAKANGCIALAVATGHHDRRALDDARPHATLDSLANPAPLLNRLRST